MLDSLFQSLAFSLLLPDLFWKEEVISATPETALFPPLAGMSPSLRNTSFLSLTYEKFQNYDSPKPKHFQMELGKAIWQWPADVPSFKFWKVRSPCG